MYICFSQNGSDFLEGVGAAVVVAVAERQQTGGGDIVDAGLEHIARGDVDPTVKSCATPETRTILGNKRTGIRRRLVGGKTGKDAAADVTEQSVESESASGEIDKRHRIGSVTDKLALIDIYADADDGAAYAAPFETVFNKDAANLQIAAVDIVRPLDFKFEV